MSPGQRQAGKKPERFSLEQTSPQAQRLFAEAIQNHNSGRLGAAEQLYRQLLAVEPRHAPGLDLLGMIAYQTDRSALAVELIENAISVFDRDASFHSHLGTVLASRGELDRAEASLKRSIDLAPKLADSHNSLGNILSQRRDFNAAQASYRRAISLKPDYAEAYDNLSHVFLEIKNWDSALACIRKSIALQSRNPVAQNNLGNVLCEQGKPGEAEAAYRSAIASNPNFAEAHNNLGNLLAGQHKLDEAVQCFARAFGLRPDLPRAGNNLGTALWSLGRLEEAETVYRRATQTEPNSTLLLGNLASLLLSRGNPGLAQDAIMQSLGVRETQDSKHIFVDVIAASPSPSNDNKVRGALTRALTEPWGQTDQLARAAIDLVKCDPDIASCVAKAHSAWPQNLAASELYGPVGLTKLAMNPLLQALLCSTPNIDIGLERLLTMARAVLLDTAFAAPGTVSDAALQFYSALARQCFINEYVFRLTPSEGTQLEKLKGAMGAALASGDAVPAIWLAAIGSYCPLGSLPNTERLLARDWPEAMMSILAQQIAEPKEELLLQRAIPCVARIEDAVSRRVHAQYEQNPYPRWVKTAAVPAHDIRGYLHRKFPLAQFQAPIGAGSADHLIAGCGTGRQSVEAAQRFSQNRILAVDLSLSSLGYAKRKAEELALTSIEFAQADILALGSVDRKFDVIECAGVLHHMADPFAGWQLLLSLLRPGGCMMIGLYSAVARQEIVRVRNFIAERGYASTAADIRRCRQDLLDMDVDANFAAILKSPDFFSISACRDLVLHMQEQQLTLESIAEFIQRNDMKFLGFEIAGGILRAYRQSFPDDPSATNLDHWAMFERERPNIFSGMYQFWIQKNGSEAALRN